jgi:hypothetical protein
MNRDILVRVSFLNIFITEMNERQGQLLTKTPNNGLGR